jgi:uncharacterized protein GlcG (DUF336 family)
MNIGLRIVSVLALSACTLALQAQQPPRGTPAALPSAGNGPPPPTRPPQAVTPGSPPAPRPPAHVARAPSLAAALKMAEAIVASCQGYHVGVAVLDAEGGPKLYYIPDGTASFHAYNGFRKANTALQFGMPSGKAAAAIKTDPQLAAKFEADAGNYLTYAGGVVITAGAEVIGAVGVSGAEPSEKDEACAMDGVKAVQSMLK